MQTGRTDHRAVAAHGTAVLGGRDRGKLKALEQEIRQRGGNAVHVVCGLSDIASVERAAAEVVSFNLPLAGLVNNAVVVQMHPTKNARGWDMSYATNHIGPLRLTEALMPYLPDAANVVFVVSAVEDPERNRRICGFSRRREANGNQAGCTKPGFDAYAPTKQAMLAAALAFDRENPRLHINAIEPGFNPSTGLGAADVNPSCA